MAYPVTLTVLRQRVLQRANLEGAGSFVPLVELTDMVNQSIAEWYDLVRLTTFGGQYYRSAYTFSTVAGTQLYALPPDFLALISGDVFISSNWKVCMRPYQEEDRNSLTGPALGVGWFGPQVWYQLQGPSISFLSSPTAAYSVVLNYVPTAPILNGGEDPIDCINGWEEFIVIKAAMKLLFKDGQLEAKENLREDLEEQRQRIASAAAERDTGIAETVHDLVGSNATGYGFTGYGEGWP